MAGTDIETVRAFNAAINSRDASGLEALMSNDHRFVDAAGAAITGKASCLDAWQSFFRSFPDYQNVFESFAITSPGHVEITGHSTCSYEPLEGPAQWHATVVDDLITEWRVEDLTDHS